MLLDVSQLLVDISREDISGTKGLSDGIVDWNDDFASNWDSRPFNLLLLVYPIVELFLNISSSWEFGTERVDITRIHGGVRVEVFRAARACRVTCTAGEAPSNGLGEKIVATSPFDVKSIDITLSMELVLGRFGSVVRSLL